MSKMYVKNRMNDNVIDEFLTDDIIHIKTRNVHLVEKSIECSKGTIEYRKRYEDEPPSEKVIEIFRNKVADEMYFYDIDEVYITFA